MTILDFLEAKKQKKKISMVTCYDNWSAKLIERTNIDGVLVGDSAAMVMHGYQNTIPATMEMMALHTRAVAQGLKKKLVVADLPFLSFRKSIGEVVTAIEPLMRAGAHAVKLEGSDGNLELIKHLTESGVPVMGHLGLTPQFVHMLGGYRVQGKDDVVAKKIYQAALQLQEAGCFSIVLECVPNKLADTITQELKIPTIGIGAGLGTDGQILVLQDMLGVNPDFKPKFVRTFMNGAEQIERALNQYDHEVKHKTFPAAAESYE